MPSLWSMVAKLHNKRYHLEKGIINMKRGDIYFTKIKDEGRNVQSGLRPVIVIQNNVGNQFSPTVIVASITSVQKKPLPTHLFIGTSGGLYKPSTILCEQLHTMNKTDLDTYVGCISDPHTLAKLDKCILISLGIDRSN